MTRQDLISQIRKKSSFLCVGLDTDLNKIPGHLLKSGDPVFEFNKAIIDATADLCVAYKPNLAFYEVLGPSGMESLKKTVDYIPEGILKIGDAKRGDIGNTGKRYADTFFDHYGFDAVTVSPLMGKDSLDPFLSRQDKWTIILALTSNAGSVDFQMRVLESGEKFYEHILTTTSGWGHPGQVMYVVGATRAEYLSGIRKIVPDHFLLVPGIGSQGGSLEEVVQNGMNTDIGLIINSSRSIIYASDGEDFHHAARHAASTLAEKMKNMLDKV